MRFIIFLLYLLVLRRFSSLIKFTYLFGTLQVYLIIYLLIKSYFFLHFYNLLFLVRYIIIFKLISSESLSSLFLFYFILYWVIAGLISAKGFPFFYFLHNLEKLIIQTVSRNIRI